MHVSSGEPGVAAVLADLTEALTGDLHVETFLASVCRYCAAVVGVPSVAMVYTSRPGTISAGVVSSDEAGRRLASGTSELPAGPWEECMTTGSLIRIPDVRAESDRWPWFAREAARAGLVTITMVPISGHADVRGALALMGGAMPDAAGIQLARSLAEAAGTAIVLSDELRRRETAINQLQSALTSRIVIEQAKGILAERWQITPGEAFNRLRRHARATRRRLPDLARAVIDGSVELALPDASGPAR